MLACAGAGIQMKYWLWLFMIVTSCVTEKQLIFSSELLSYTHSDLPKKPIKRGDYVLVKYCSDEEVPKYLDKEKTRDWGPLDFLMDKAHREHKAEYFVKATVYHFENCVTMRGYKGIY